MPDRPADRRLRLLRQALAELEHAADEYDEARPGLGAVPATGLRADRVATSHDPEQVRYDPHRLNVATSRGRWASASSPPSSGSDASASKTESPATSLCAGREPAHVIALAGDASSLGARGPR